MRLLFDQNLSPQLCNAVRDAYPGSVHVRGVGLQAASDTEVWRYARDNDLVIVSKGSDFHQRSMLFGHPPKVVWLRLGNCSTRDIEAVLRHRVDAITRIVGDTGSSFLIVP